MLTFEEFLSLDEDLQIQVLSLDGVDLELKRTCRNLSVELYSLYKFYIEIFFDKMTEEPLYLKAFKKAKYLEPYLQQIDLTEILGIREQGF